jgi:surface protein
MDFEGIDDVVPEDVGRHILSFLDVPTLVQKKAVCRSWHILFTDVIRQKALIPQAFQSLAELREAVDKYTEYNIVDADEFAETYGWPIDRWDVSNIQDFRYLFYSKVSFNESIGSWNTSNATSMRGMFQYARSFDQDISAWNTSNVTDMWNVFQYARSFNQDISAWNTSNVTDMDAMFKDARSFNQDISAWDTSNVRNMNAIFQDARSFNQDISAWNTSNT